MAVNLPLSAPHAHAGTRCVPRSLSPCSVVTFAQIDSSSTSSASMAYWITWRALRLTSSSNVSPIPPAGLTSCFRLSFFMGDMVRKVSDFDNQILYRNLHHLLNHGRVPDFGLQLAQFAAEALPL